MQSDYEISRWPSMHSSEVVNPRELKTCELCGGIFVRIRADFDVITCPSCRSKAN